MDVFHLIDQGGQFWKCVENPRFFSDPYTHEPYNSLNSIRNHSLSISIFFQFACSIAIIGMV